MKSRRKPAFLFLIGGHQTGSVMTPLGTKPLPPLAGESGEGRKGESRTTSIYPA